MSKPPTARDRDRRRNRPPFDEDDRPDPDTGTVVELLGDECAREVLAAVADEATSGRAIAEATSLSRPTVYRRLDRLEDAGFLEVTMEVRRDGNHRRQFRSTLDSATVAFDDELSASVRTERETSDPDVGSELP